MSFLQIDKVCKSFGPINVLRDISLDVEEGGFLVLVGPSGCGKSTLLNTIAGLEKLTTGEIRIDGNVIDDLPPAERNIAMVFQSYALYPNMNVGQNIAFGLEMRGMPKGERDAKVAEAAKTLQIEHLLDRKPGQLSGGQRQRVAMGRALVRNPQLFLFDEPLSNLDAKLRVDMRTEIKRMHQTFGTTIVYVTHDQIEAMTLGTRIAVLKDGVVQQYGTPAEIYNDPTNLFVADFMGSPAMNLIPATVRGNGVEMARADEDPLVLGFDQLPGDVAAYEGQEVIVGIRPEAITDADSRAAMRAGQQVTASCKIDVVEPAGADIYAITALGGKEVVTRLHQDWFGQANQHTELVFNLEKVVFFDPQSGVRLR
ncbi:ABC transporter ATP-binding protein [Thalassospira lucentensis]|uniref:ABC transporter ATP-binding protein n=1 Tax=Thalassospira lucentensis TaxID=168935 RepID=UPI0003B76305|nr:ABC transporter ATP-binding protein [Thalassospira lucentensis]RCK20012.1 sugar ABC transporter ATPase [Thalassospira lucentensis MCCC 1A00383 = DSM 14000]